MFRRFKRVCFEMQRFVVFYLAATFGYINAICWVRFGLFIAFYTGNLVVAIFAFAELAWKEAAFRVVVMLSYTFIGVKASQFIEERAPSPWWHLQSLWILLAGCLLFAECAFPSSRDPSEHQSQIGGFHSYYVLSETESAKISVIAACMGAMGHFSTRLPVPTQVMTITMIKLSEMTRLLPWKRRRDIDDFERGAESKRLRHFSLAGCITGVTTAAGLMVALPTRSYTLLPVLIFWPLMMHAQARSSKFRHGDCCEEPDSEVYQISIADEEDVGTRESKGLENSDDSLGIIVP